MVNQTPKSGTNDVNSYLIAGVPFIISGTATSAVRIKFPTVTNWVSIKNTGMGGSTILAVGFTQNGMIDNPTGTNRRFFLRESEERNIPIRVKEIWVSGSSGNPQYDVIAGLTTVMTDSFPTLTSSVSLGTDLVPPIMKGVG